jgi:hypothetical protein
VQKEKLIKISMIVSAIGIFLDIVSTWWGLSTNPDLRETGSLIIPSIRYFGLVPGLIIGGIVNIIITGGLFFLYKTQKDDGKLLWTISFLRMWVVTENFLLAMRMSFFLINLVEWAIIGGMCFIIFNLLTRRENA